MVVRSRTVAQVATAVCIALTLALPSRAAAAPLLTSGELVEHAADWDGKRIAFEGEVIGSAMHRGDVTWLHVNDDAYVEQQASTGPLAGYNSGQAIRVPTSLTTDLQHFGAHQQQGDLVRIEGTFFAADPQAGGDMLIAADSLTVIARGRRTRNLVPSTELATVAILALATFIAFMWRRQVHLVRIR